MRRLLLVLALLTLAAPAAATTYYVTTAGSDSNPGTQASPFRTPQKAATVVNPGDIVLVGDGTYTDTDVNDIVLYIQRSGSSGSPITFKSLNKWGAVISGNSHATKHGIHVSANWIIVQDFDITGQGGKATGQGGDAVDVNGDNISIVGNRIHDVGRYCTDEPYGLDGILVENQTGTVVSGNLIYNIGRFIPGESGCSPSQTYYQNNDHAIYLDGPSTTLIKNNVFYDNGHGWSIHAYPNAITGLTIVNNTFANPNIYRVGHIVLQAAITGADISNNIFYDPTTAGIRYAGGTMSGVTVRNNLTYDGVSLWNDTNGTQTVSGITKSGNLDNTNPLFTNQATHDYSLTTTSPAKEAGLTIAAVTDDYLGLSRPKGPLYDIGAYEFNTPPASLISTNRSLDWSVAGTTVQSRSTICTTLQPPSSSAAINSAIANCGAGQVVKLAAGTFTINGGLNISRNDVTLRGSGPTQTTLQLFSYDSCNGQGAGICVTGSGTVPFPPDSPRNLANWTAGFAKGATAITLSSVANLQVGSTIILDQLDDSTPDFNGIANCANRTGAQAAWCSGEGANNLSMDSQRVQHETHKVVSIAGNVVTITPALAWPNWSLSKAPHAWWGSSLPVTGVGIEDLKLDATNEGCGAFFSSCGGILFFYAADSWVKNVEVFKMAISQMKLYESRNITIRDSYLRTSKSLGSTAYGLLLFYSSYNLIENNIFQDIVAGALLHGVGNVVGYNYMLDDTYNPSGAPFPPGNSQMQAGMYHHNGGAGYELWEGNDANSFKADAIHGTSNLTTVFRNRLTGYENLKDQHTNPVFVYAWNRYFNFVGNVLGTSTYHTTSGTYASSFNSSAIYRFGETPNYCPWAGSSGGGCTVTGGFTDARVAATSMRWGNYDTVHAANQFVNAEVPSGDANYPNPVPANQTLPTSLYRSTTAPTWWATPWGTPGYPAIGPDVTGGSITGLAGHAQKIPARLCYENMSHTTTGSTTGTIQLISNFNADVCYPTTGSPTDTTPPVVTITTNSGVNFSTVDPLLTTLAGGAVDDIQVMFDCRWTNAANAGAGTAPGAFTWSVASIPLALGPNLITVFCHDAANNEGNDTITVTLDQPPPSGPFYRLRIGG